MGQFLRDELSSRLNRAQFGVLATICVFVGLFGSGVSQAMDMTGEFAAGIATPAPTGITIKYWNSRDTAYDAFAEWSFADKKYNFHADYLVHDFNQVYMDDADVPVYYGMGVRLIEEKDEDLITGVRIPFGISYLQRSRPFDIFAEVAPRINLTPSTNFGLDLQIGIRFRF